MLIIACILGGIALGIYIGVKINPPPLAKEIWGEYSDE